MRADLYLGDCRESLRAMPAASVHCAVTSPPFYGLRDYGVDGQLGLEGSPAEYVEALRSVFREVRRVLRPDGCLWLNLGDSYASGEVGRVDGAGPGRALGLRQSERPERRVRQDTGVPAKNLLGVPWRVAFALQADGWWLRSEVTWCKRAPMPESVTDRPTSATEKIFLLAPSERYYYDAVAVREPFADERMGNPGNYRPDYSIGSGRNDADAKNVEWLAGEERGGRNLRNWWPLSPQPYPEAHFAVFPAEIPRRCILAGTSERGACPECGAPWRRVVERTGTIQCGSNGDRHKAKAARGRVGTTSAFHSGQVAAYETSGWDSGCSCDAGEPVPCRVLDPFSGAGTTGVVAGKLGRDYVGCEINPQYVEMSERRILQEVGPLLVTVERREVAALAGVAP